MGDPNNGNADASGDLLMSQYSSGSFDHEWKLSNAGVLTTEGAMNASTTVDYAEFFEWATPLADDDAVLAAQGMTVILENGKVKLASDGEEAKVIGVVRPNDTSAMVAGGHDFRYKDQYERDVWGVIVTESYTACKWDETITRDNGNTYIQNHNYMKDRMPSKRVKEQLKGLDTTNWNWHTETANYELDSDGNQVTLVVPSTDSEKEATNYREETKVRNKINSSFDLSKTYIPRKQRRKEWAVIGLLGQVPIRSTAIVPTSWTKMKNLETGIDLYYIK